MQTSKINFILLVSIFFITFSNINAQPPHKVGERMRTLKKMKLLEVLDLNEEISDKFLSKYNVLEKNIKDKRDQLNTANNQLEDALKKNKSDKELSDLSNKLLSAEQDYQQALNKRFDEMKDILTTKQYAQYLVFEKKFLEKVKDIIKNRNKNLNSNSKR